jgi:hypothetical protein
MSKSDMKMDQANEEFDALLAALPRRRSASASSSMQADSVLQAGLSDDIFENLLNEFRSLSNATPSRSQNGRGEQTLTAKLETGSAHGMQSELAAMIHALARDRDCLMASRDVIHDAAAIAAITSLDRLTTNMQIVLMRDQPDKILLLQSGSQYFALPLSAVLRVYERKEIVIDEEKGARVGDSWLPVRFLGAYRRGNGSASSASVHGCVVIIANQDSDMVLCVESAVGVVSSTFVPLDAVLQGAQGLSGIAITETGTHALVLDINRLIQKA